MGSVLKERQRRGMGIHRPALESGPEEKARRNRGNAAGRINLLAYADGLLLAKSEQE